ncbi:hypothetical protein SLS60_005049 [Paraconiothyrium brasiliense]|uniref:Aminoglycoside phosphotransferase domain-containing protein n=1 Tax=Paraconiothyrium brasiliense TaxID=300254 RepID=A0ABR3RHV2_9PLEO
MNFIDGILLESDRLAEFPVETQDRIFAKVSAQIQYLRSLPSEGYYGRVHRQGWVDPPPGLRTDTGLVRNVVGPYNTYEEYTSAIHSAFEINMAVGSGPYKKEWWPSYTANSVELLSIFPGWLPHEPKFTWPDPKLTNIIVRPIKDESGNEDWEVFLIDWEGAGWHPAWVQALQFQKRCGAMIRDRSQAPSASGHHPLLPYRSGEILAQMLKGFDPNPDWERLGKIRKHDWWFY